MSTDFDPFGPFPIHSNRLDVSIQNRTNELMRQHVPKSILTVLTPTSTLFFQCLQVTISKKMLLKVYKIENAIPMTLVWTVENDRNASN